MIMATEKEIRAFFKENKISFPEGDSFMDEVIRRIDLLPVPSALKKNDGHDLHRIDEICNAFAKWSRRRTIVAMLAGIVSGIATAALSGLFSFSGATPGEILAKSILSCAAVLLSLHIVPRLYPPFRIQPNDEHRK